MSIFRRRPSKVDEGEENIEEEFRNIQSGWLTKKKFRSKKEWCSLSGCNLSFWKDQEEHQNSPNCHSSSFMDISTATSVMTAMSANSPHGFDITTPKGKTTMMAESKAECMQWMKNLQMSMQYRKRAATMRQSKTASSASTLTSVSSETNPTKHPDLEYQPSLDDPFDTPASTPDTNGKQFAPAEEIAESDESSQATEPSPSSSLPTTQISDQTTESEPPVEPEPSPDVESQDPAAIDDDGEALYENYDAPAPVKPVRPDLPPPPPPPTPVARSYVPTESPSNGMPTVNVIPASIINTEDEHTEEKIVSEPNYNDNQTNGESSSQESDTKTNNKTTPDTQTADNQEQNNQSSAGEIADAAEKDKTDLSAVPVQKPASAPQPIPAKRGSHGTPHISPQMARIKPQPRIASSIRKKTVSVMPMMPALSEDAENAAGEDGEELYENTADMSKPALPSDDSHPTVVVEDESGPVKVRVRTPSITGVEAGGVGGALPSANELYGEVIKKYGKPVDVRSKYASTCDVEDTKDEITINAEKRSIAIRQLRDYLALPPNTQEKSENSGFSHAKILERAPGMQALHDLLKR